MAISLALISLLAACTACGGDSGPPTSNMPVPPPEGRYVAPTGSGRGNGSAGQPWDLATALLQPSDVVPGDTIWLRGGVYRGCFTSQLTGTASERMQVMQYPGEHAVIDNAGCSSPALTVRGAYTDFQGFEVTNSAPRKGGPQAIDAFGDEIRFINLVIHDAAGSGIGFWKDAAGGEVYGCILYNNGRNSNLDHGIYTQNEVGTKRIVDNVIFDSWAFGLHVYGSDEAPLTGYTIEGNALFDNGSIGENGEAPNLLVGGGTPAARIVVRDNYLYGPRSGTGNMWLGYEAPNRDLVLEGNVVVGGDPALRLWRWSTVTAQRNSFADAEGMVDVQGDTRGVRWDGASFLADPSMQLWKVDDDRLSLADWLARTGFGGASARASQPSAPWVFVRPNVYEPGRGHVIVYTWGSGANAVEADLSDILKPGDGYEVRQVERVLGDPLLTGVYAGGTVSLPMTPVSSPPPTGGSARPASSARPAFGVFLVTRTPAAAP